MKLKQILLEICCPEYLISQQFASLQYDSNPLIATAENVTNPLNKKENERFIFHFDILV